MLRASREGARLDRGRRVRAAARTTRREVTADARGVVAEAPTRFCFKRCGQKAPVAAPDLTVCALQKSRQIGPAPTASLSCWKMLKKSDDFLSIELP